MKASRARRSSFSSLLILAGVGLTAAYGFARWRRDPRFFAGKTVVLSGGSRGLGLVMARLLHAEGAQLALLARDAEELDRARQDLLAGGKSGAPSSEVFCVPCDLSQPAQIKAAIAAAAAHFGGIDVLINNAGTIQVGPLQNQGVADFAEAMDLHFWGNFHLVWESLAHLRRSRSARIVNIASIGGRVAVPHLAPYSASKFALVGLSEAFGVELAREGIRVTTVSPGLMRTGSHVNAKFKGQHAKEFDWFSTSNNFPLDSTSAESSARRIIEACRSGQRVLSFPLSTRAAEIGHAVFPNLTARALELVNRWVLPAPGTGPDADELRPGKESRSPETTPTWKTGFVDKAAADNNEATALQVP